jgi:replicative DNA helicase
MGKTQIALNILNSVAFKHPVLYYSFDLSKFMFSSRLLSLISGIPADKIISQQLSDEQKDNLTQVAEYYRRNRKIFINDTGNQSIQALRKQCEKYVDEHGVKLICIDYIQLMSSRKYSYQRESELGYISRELKKMAKDLNICIIAMSQLSRAVEMRGGSKRPILSDLRQSGSLEQDADKVIMVYRPDYYNITEDEEGRDARCVVELIVAKNRSGKTGTVYLKRDEQFIKLEEHKPFEQFHFVDNRINELKQDSPPLDIKDDELPF